MSKLIKGHKSTVSLRAAALSLLNVQPLLPWELTVHGVQVVCTGRSSRRNGMMLQGVLRMLPGRCSLCGCFGDPTARVQYQ